MVQLKSLL